MPMARYSKAGATPLPAEPDRWVGRSVPRRPHDRKRERHGHAGIRRDRRDVVGWRRRSRSRTTRQSRVVRSSTCSVATIATRSCRSMVTIATTTPSCARRATTPSWPRVTQLETGAPFDFKLLIHGIHAATYNFGGETFADIRYPGKIQNCEGCHKPDTYYPVDPNAVFATSVTRGANAATPADDVAFTPNAAICSSCHTVVEARAHIEQTGGSFERHEECEWHQQRSAGRNLRHVSRRGPGGGRESRTWCRRVPDHRPMIAEKLRTDAKS